MSQDIIELIDEQLAAGEPENGYDYDNPDYPRCGHCGRHWHGLRITQRIANMYAWGRYDPEYVAAEDNSPILCEGSNFIGPQRPAAVKRRIMYTVNIDPPVARIEFGAFLGVIPGAPWIRYWDSSTWLIQPEQPIECAPLPDDVTIRFGPENWMCEIRRMPPPQLQFPRQYPRFLTPVGRAVRTHWSGFTTPDYPIPDQPGYDFSHLANNDAPIWAARADGRKRQ